MSIKLKRLQQFACFDDSDVILSKENELIESI